MCHKKSFSLVSGLGAADYLFFLFLELPAFLAAFFLAALGFLAGFLVALFFGAAALALGAAASSSPPSASVSATGADLGFLCGSSGAVKRWPSNAISVMRTAV